MPFSICPACLLPSEKPISNLPCGECLSSLLLAPRICRSCLGFSCEPTACLRPWMRVEGEEGLRLFDSVTSAYLSIGPGASVLKSWKKAASPALQRILTQGVTHALESRSTPPLLLIPVPQSSARKWQLGGGSVLRLCEMIAHTRTRTHAHTEILDLLEVVHLPETNQARMKGDGRYRREQSIQMKSTEVLRELREKITLVQRQDPEILLVDDFLTSGATLRSSLQVIRLGFEDLGLFAGRRTRIGAFVLGFRPSLSG